MFKTETREVTFKKQKDPKITFVFRVHNDKEKEAFGKIIKGRQFKIRNLYVLNEDYISYDSFEDFCMDEPWCDDFLAKVYFDSPNPSMYRFIRRVKSNMEPFCCGHADCSNTICEHHYNNALDGYHMDFDIDYPCDHYTTKGANNGI